MWRKINHITMIELSNEEYHSDTTRISKSGLDLINKSPALYWERYLNPNREPEQQTEAKAIGSVIHHAILEPHLFERRYHCLNDEDVIAQIGGKSPRNTNKYRDWLAEQMAMHADKKLLGQNDFIKALRMRDAVHAHPAAAVLLKSGLAEQTVFFDEPNTGANCKIRPDWISDTGFTVDVKSAEDASLYGFGKSSLNYRYDVQASFYDDGIAYATGRRPEGFAFIAVEKDPPYLVGVYFVTNDVFDLGRRKYLQNLQTYIECKNNNIWPGYSAYMEPLTLPAYALK